MTEPTIPGGLPPWIRVWFALDALFFLFPPIHWATNAFKIVVLSLPFNLLYFAVGCAFITCSVVVAYVCDPTHREPGR